MDARDIRCYAEILIDGEWKLISDQLFCRGAQGPFAWRNYGVFGFFANVCNYSWVPPISSPRGFPSDLSPAVYIVAAYFGGLTEEDAGWILSKNDKFVEQLDKVEQLPVLDASWISLRELLQVDYDLTFCDRKYQDKSWLKMRPWFKPTPSQVKGDGEVKTLREFLGADYFSDLDKLAGLGEPDKIRIVFWFVTAT